MSIHDIRRLKRASLQPKPTLMDGFMEFPKDVPTKAVEKTPIPRLNLIALREPNPKNGKSCAEVQTSKR
jgi:hypothetical protein